MEAREGFDNIYYYLLLCSRCRHYRRHLSSIELDLISMSQFFSASNDNHRNNNNYRNNRKNGVSALASVMTIVITYSDSTHNPAFSLDLLLAWLSIMSDIRLCGSYWHPLELLLIAALSPIWIPLAGVLLCLMTCISQCLGVLELSPSSYFLSRPQTCCWDFTSIH